jgi:hypothetical protein
MLAFAANEELFKCVHRTAGELKHNPPTHVAVSTDAANMFNTTNQEECARTLAKKMPALYHFYQNMYGRDLRIWFPDEDGVPQFFSQKDGHIQGGPLSGTFSAITIMPLIEDIKSHMDEAYLPTRNARRASETYEKGHSCFHPFEPKGLVDDVTWLPPIKHTLEFFELCERLGPKYGFTLNKAKNKICISTNGIDPRPFLKTKVRKQLNQAIKRYTNGEVNLGGLTILGIPVESPTFIRSELQKFDKTLADDTFGLL